MVESFAAILVSAIYIGLIALVAYILYRIIRAAVRDGIRDARM